jgi:methylenetetrahydrofolate dehydrogenase (NADP+)/methenyltetrahydrofolate cyclohydrolase
MAKIVDGKKIAQEIEGKLKREVSLLGKRGLAPKLVSIIIGEDPISHLYVRLKQKAAERVGIEFEKKVFPVAVGHETLKMYFGLKNKDKRVHGIMVQLPIPGSRSGKTEDGKQRTEDRVLKILSLIDPKKDVDCLTPENFGLLAMGRQRFLPATVEAVLTILKHEKVKLLGKNIVVVGASNIVGKPLALILKNLNEMGTVTICRSKTKDLPSFTKKADILISATGVCGLIGAEMVKSGAVVVDVGESRIKGKVVGDVDFEQVKNVASLITPVPGGVGPLTVMSLLKNTFLAACHLGQGVIK